MDRHTVWLSLDQRVQLVERDKSGIPRHQRNLFNKRALERLSVVAQNATTAADGKTYPVHYFSLDVFISVGYRIKSQRAVQFRQWATSTLKQQLGIAIEQALALFSRTLAAQELADPYGEAVWAVLHDYAAGAVTEFEDANAN